MKKLPLRETELFVQDTCPVSGGLKTSTPVSAHMISPLSFLLLPLTTRRPGGTTIKSATLKITFGPEQKGWGALSLGGD